MRTSYMLYATEKLTLKVDPQVVRVEDLELADRLELLSVLRGDLSNFEELHVALVVDEGTTLQRKTFKIEYAYTQK